MKPNFSETKSANVWIENGVIFIKCLPDSIITRKEAEQITAERIRISNGTSHPVCMDIRSAKYITMDARQHLKQTGGMQFVSAYAFVVDSHVHNVIINYFLTINPPALPSVNASKKAAALNWLESYKTTEPITTFSEKELVA